LYIWYKVWIEPFFVHLVQSLDRTILCTFGTKFLVESFHWFYWYKVWIEPHVSSIGTKIKGVAVGKKWWQIGEAASDVYEEE
jgi:hypothetical protein